MNEYSADQVLSTTLSFLLWCSRNRRLEVTKFGFDPSLTNSINDSKHQLYHLFLILHTQSLSSTFVIKMLRRPATKIMLTIDDIAAYEDRRAQAEQSKLNQTGTIQYFYKKYPQADDDQPGCLT